MKNGGSRGQQMLVERVLNKGICVKCGACVGLCPYFSYWDGEVVALDACQAETWRCLQYCPRAGYEGTALRDNGTHEEGAVLGPVKEIWAAQAADMRSRELGQYGGVVSSLLIFAMNKNFIHSAVVTDAGNAGPSPSGKLVKSPSGILECSGSRYAAAGSLAIFNQAVDRGEDRIGVVGLPCQMEALERMARSGSDAVERTKRVKLKIGLFCTWALDHRMLKKFLEARSIEGPVRKFDIPPPPAETFMLLTESGWVHIPLGEVRNLVQKGCGLCEDMTAEWADISVGAVEGRNNWNTVVIRTKTGAKLFKEAVEAGAIEVEKLPRENLDHLTEAASNKRKRAEIARRNGQEGHDEGDK